MMGALPTINKAQTATFQALAMLQHSAPAEQKKKLQTKAVDAVANLSAFVDGMGTNPNAKLGTLVGCTDAGLHPTVAALMKEALPFYLRLAEPSLSVLDRTLSNVVENSFASCPVIKNGATALKGAVSDSLATGLQAELDSARSELDSARSERDSARSEMQESERLRKGLVKAREDLRKKSKRLQSELTKARTEAQTDTKKTQRADKEQRAEKLRQKTESKKSGGWWFWG